MGFFLTIVCAIFLLDLLWWWQADRLLRPLRAARWWRAAWGAFMAVQFVSLLLLFFGRFLRIPFGSGATTGLVIAVFVWHLMVLPVTVLLWSGIKLAELPAIVWGRLRPYAPAVAVEAAQSGRRETLSRREALGVAFTAAPPLIAAVATGVSIQRLDDFRVRPITITLPQLPRDLDGMTIAHVTDVHVGDFTHGRTLDAIVEATNALRADLVLMTGDLINRRLSDLPSALDMVRRLDARHGVYLCEGNHDLFEGREAFGATVRGAGVPLLINEQQSLRVRGHDVQLLGLRWGRPGPGGHRSRGDEAISESMSILLPQVRPDAFPILLAHHPHAFDFAAAAGLPLTLAGHTHGGQLMLTRHIGAGNLVGFRYFSGLYRQGSNALVVSNGVGNWFPLRVGAPAEIIHLTLRC